jgi:hypothetical protein
MVKSSQWLLYVRDETLRCDSRIRHDEKEHGIAVQLGKSDFVNEKLNIPCLKKRYKSSSSCCGCEHIRHAHLHQHKRLFEEEVKSARDSHSSDEQTDAGHL